MNTKDDHIGLQARNNGWHGLRCAKPAPWGINRCDDWKEIHSPDWYRETPGHFYTDYANPHTGSAFAGFSKSEGLQVKLNSPISPTEEHELVSIGFWFSPETDNNMEINLYLRNEEYLEGNELLDVNMENSLHITIPVVSEGLSALHVPGQWYHYQMPPVLWTSDDEPDWLVIAGNPPGDTYVFIDDIEVYQFSACAHTCVADDGLLRIKTTQDSYLYEEPSVPDPETPVLLIFTPENNPDVITAMIGNNYISTFFMLIENSVRVQFEVWSSDGQLMWREDSYDYNGLHDEIDGVIYPDFAIVWNGNTLFGGTLPNDVYEYTVEITQCQGPPILIESSIYIEVQFPPALEYPYLGTATNSQIELCCQENYLIQNTVYAPLPQDEWFRLDANSSILAGENLDPMQPSGPVVVQSGAKVAYYAGLAVILAPGFTNLSSEFVADIFPCGAAPRNMNSNRREVLRSRDENLQFPLSGELNISPVPSESIVSVSSLSNIENIEVYSSIGNLVLTQNVMANIANIDLSLLPKGVYFLKVHTPDGIQIGRAIKE